MRRRLLSVCIVAALSGGYAAAAFAQAKPETLVKQRKAAMTMQGKYFYGSLNPMAQGKIPYDAAVAARNAGYLEVLSKLPWDGFAESTKDQKDTGALPAIWTEPAKFKAAQDRLQTAVAALVAATKGGNEATVKAAIGDLGKACGNCHDNFAKQ
jgi:cytochrome c556